MTISNEELQREIDLLKVENHVIKADNMRLSTNNDEMKKENAHLTTVLNKMDIDNQDQIQQINSSGSEMEQLRKQLYIKVSQGSRITHYVCSYSGKF